MVRWVGWSGGKWPTCRQAACSTTSGVADLEALAQVGRLQCTLVCMGRCVGRMGAGGLEAEAADLALLVQVPAG